MTFLDFVARLDTLAVGMIDDAQLSVSIPAILDAAEQRIYRELDLLAAEVTDASGALAQGNRVFAFASAVPFVVLMKVNLLSNGARTQMEPVSRDLLDAVYGSAADTGLPRWFAMLDAATLAVGPWPDQAYGVEVVGKVRPASLYTLGPTGTSFLSLHLPDLLLAAAMAFLEAPTAPAPLPGAKAPMPRWEGQYQALKASAAAEEARRQFMGPGWTSLSMPAGASPER